MDSNGMPIRLVLIMLGLFFILPLTHAQNCAGMHKMYGELVQGYVYDHQSRSTSAIIGKKKEISLVFYEGRAYKVSICTNPEITDRVEITVKDAFTKTVVFNNANLFYTPEFEMVSSVTKRYVIEVRIKGKNDGPGAGNNYGKTACLGLYMQSKHH